MTLILGKAVATAQQMSTYLLSINQNPKFSRNISALDFCQLFLDVCAKEGVRGDIAFAQSCKETANFKYGGDVLYTQNNFSGLGATGGGVRGCVFSTIEEGILAQAQHLKTYATKNALNEPCVDPRRTTWFINTKGGTSPEVETLGGTWAVPGYDTKKYDSLDAANKARDSYGYQIINILDKILKTNKEVKAMAYTNSSLVTCVVKSPNHSGARKYALSRITPHCVVGQLDAQKIGSLFLSTSKQASCNYAIGKSGDVCLVVDEANRSWCTSNADNDNRAITIECASDTTHPYAFTNACYEKLVELCIDICRRNGKTKLLWLGTKEATLAYNPKADEMVLTAHRWFKNKACPGDWMYSREGDLANRVTAALSGNAAIAQPEPKPAAPTPTTSANNTLPSAPFTVQVLVSDLNYRSEPSMNGKVKGQTGKGVFTISEVKNGWGKLKSGIGWIYLENPQYVKVNGTVAQAPAQTQPAAPADTSYKVRVATAALNIRKGPGLNYGTNGVIHMNEVYTIVDEKDGFGKLKSGAGWISLKYTKRV